MYLSTFFTLIAAMALIDVLSLFIILKNQKLRRRLRTIINDFLNEEKYENYSSEETDSSVMEGDGPGVYSENCCCNKCSEQETISDILHNVMDRQDGFEYLFEDLLERVQTAEKAGEDELYKIAGRFDRLEKEVEFLYNTMIDC